MHHFRVYRFVIFSLDSVEYLISKHLNKEEKNTSMLILQGLNKNASQKNSRVDMYVAYCHIKIQGKHLSEKLY